MLWIVKSVSSSLTTICSMIPAYSCAFHCDHRLYLFLACREHMFMQQSVLVEHITEYVQH